MTQYYQDNSQNQQYAQAWDQGTYDQLPEDQARQQYRQFVQNAPPHVVEQVHQQYYDQMPQQQRAGLLQGLMGALTQQGYDPRQAGVQTTDPNRMSPQDAARMTAYAQQQQPDILHQILGPGGPLGSTGAKLAVAGLAALAAKHFLSGQGSMGGSSMGGSTIDGSTQNNEGNSLL